MIDAPTREVRPAARRRALAPAQDVPASPSPFPHASGRHIVQDHLGLGWPEWSRGDIIEVDFDITSYRGEGLYILDSFDPNAPKWMQRFQCARYLSKAGKDNLQIRERTEDGWAWAPLTAERLAITKFIGRVARVYRDVTTWRPGLRADGVVSGMSTVGDGTTQLQLTNNEGPTITIGGVRTDLAKQCLAPLLGQRVKLTLETEELTQ